jgi:hypothetical protein
MTPAASVSPHARLEDPNSTAAATFGELETEAALANSGFADDPDHPAVAFDGTSSSSRAAN